MTDGTAVSMLSIKSLSASSARLFKIGKWLNKKLQTWERISYPSSFPPFKSIFSTGFHMSHIDHDERVSGGLTAYETNNLRSQSPLVLKVLVSFILGVYMCCKVFFSSSLMSFYDSVSFISIKARQWNWKGSERGRPSGPIVFCRMTILRPIHLKKDGKGRYKNKNRKLSYYRFVQWCEIM